MSTTLDRKPRARPRMTPMIGSLLRFPHEVVVARLLATLAQSGYDISPTELRVFLYPGPDGRRPVDLARQCDMTRQAMNYVLASLERRGYVERSVGPRSPASVVRLTERGWELVPLMRNCVAAIEKEWAAHLGTRRFEALRATLHDLSAWLGKLG
jgi:DNA-binding MarR family transcriptional regulator